MLRDDGYSMVGGLVQGARTFDMTSNQWLTPDAYAGDVGDPASQKPFMYNNNNPVEWSDPSGYLLETTGTQQQQSQEIDDWNAVKASFKDNPQATAILNNIQNNPNFTVQLAENSLGVTKFSGTYANGTLTADRIDFDPRMGIQIGDESSAAISPALALLHEADHANRFNMDYNGYAAWDRSRIGSQG
jgi:RHS repeat-associated protein